MLVESAFAAMIETVEWGSLAKVALDGSNALLYQSGYLLLIPVDCLWIRQVEHGILVRRRAAGILHCHIAIEQFAKELVLGSEVGELPQTDMESVLAHLFHHCHGIFKSVGGKLIVALPIHTKPSSVEMDYICRNLIFAQVGCNVKSLFLREISDTAHPSAECPEREHRTLACDLGIFIKDVFRFAEEYEKVHLLVTHIQTLRTYVTLAEIGCHRSGSVHEDTITTITEIERHWLVHSWCLGSLRVGDEYLYLLSH